MKTAVKTAAVAVAAALVFALPIAHVETIVRVHADECSSTHVVGCTQAGWAVWDVPNNWQGIAGTVVPNSATFDPKPCAVGDVAEPINLVCFPRETHGCHKTSCWASP